jgi:hypothetical protein
MACCVHMRIQNADMGSRSIIALLNGNSQHVVLVEKHTDKPKTTRELPDTTLIQIKRNMSASKWRQVLEHNASYVTLEPMQYSRLAVTLPPTSCFAIPLTFGRMLLIDRFAAVQMVICCRYCMRQNKERFYCKCCGTMPVPLDERFCSLECSQQERRFRAC